ncbi:MAG: hypothetical protein CMI00_10670 [Oceanospirillaceae bacterium]|nr:hypothetical protein [Oceanospirillaceae bacterium]
MFLTPSYIVLARPMQFSMQSIFMSNLNVKSWAILLKLRQSPGRVVKLIYVVQMRMLHWVWIRKHM